VIVALGESIVVVGTGAAGHALDEGLVLVALLSLSLSAALWRIYFSDEAVSGRLHGGRFCSSRRKQHSEAWRA
jgi:low temperature requirement protein LtrA